MAAEKRRMCTNNTNNNSNNNSIMMLEEKKDDDHQRRYHPPQDLIIMTKLKETGEYQRLYDSCLAKLVDDNKSNDWKEGLIEVAHEAIVEQQLQDGSLLSLERLTDTLVASTTIRKETQEAMRTLVQESIKKVLFEKDI